MEHLNIARSHVDECHSRSPDYSLQQWRELPAPSRVQRPNPPPGKKYISKLERLHRRVRNILTSIKSRRTTICMTKGGASVDAGVVVVCSAGVAVDIWTRPIRILLFSLSRQLWDIVGILYRTLVWRKRVNIQFTLNLDWQIGVYTIWKWSITALLPWRSKWEGPGSLVVDSELLSCHVRLENLLISCPTSLQYKSISILCGVLRLSWISVTPIAAYHHPVL